MGQGHIAAHDAEAAAQGLELHALGKAPEHILPGHALVQIAHPVIIAALVRRAVEHGLVHVPQEFVIRFVLGLVLVGDHKAERDLRAAAGAGGQIGRPFGHADRVHSPAQHHLVQTGDEILDLLEVGVLLFVCLHFRNVRQIGRPFGHADRVHSPAQHHLVQTGDEILDLLEVGVLLFVCLHFRNVLGVLIRFRHIGGLRGDHHTSHIAGHNGLRITRGSRSLRRHCLDLYRFHRLHGPIAFSGQCGNHTGHHHGNREERDTAFPFHRYFLHSN